LYGQLLKFLKHFDTKVDANPNKKTKPQVTPLSDAPVSYILKQIDKASEEPLNTRKVDWDLT
jgi:hypothetical protein